MLVFRAKSPYIWSMSDRCGEKTSQTAWYVAVLVCYYVYFPTLLHAATVTVGDKEGQYALTRSKEFYCQVAGTMGGDIGILLGLAISAVGFISLIFNGVSMGNIVLMLSGVLLTAIPGWFEAGINAVEQITAPLGSGGTQVSVSCG
ncbi:MAG: hypothetical protein OXR68_03145 [Alphaproteobacteria bacterium]|nr:hypothetical protein [Alphaproteobacteria bacterium]